MTRNARAGAAALALIAAAQQPAAPPKTRETPPVAGTPKDFRLPARRTITLASGMQLTMVPYGRVPKAAIEVEVRTGVIDEGANDVSLSRVMGDMLNEGTTTRSAQQIARQAAEMGGALAVTPGAEVLSLGGEVLSDFVPQYVALVADVARNPKFDGADLKRILDKHARDNAIALQEPGTLAQKRFREVVYGNHPFARLYPSEEMLRSFTVDRVRAFYTSNMGARRAHIYISGVFDAAEVERAARAAFGDWASGSPPTVNPPQPAARRQLELVDRPKSVQSSIWMGLPVTDPSSPDWIRMNVTDALLGGAFGSRITSNIREEKGYTYSPFSFLWTRKGSSLWVEVADVTTNVTGASLTEIFKEVDRLRTEAPPERELAGIRNNMAGVFTIRNGSRTGVLGQLQFADLHGLGDGYLASYVKNVLAVTPEEVRSTAQKYLDPAKVSIAIVGDRKVVEPQLGAFKTVVP